MHFFREESFLIGFSELPDGDFSDLWKGDPLSGTRWEAVGKLAGVSLAFPRFAHQIHGNEIIEVLSSAPVGLQGDGDALWSRATGIPLGIFTADCLPIMISGQRGVAAVHAGWKSTRLDIAGKIVRHFVEVLEEKPHELKIFMGPCIGACCLDLGDEVPPTFFERDSAYAACFSHGKKWHLDLRALNSVQCLQHGVSPNQIRHVNFCTKCHPERYFSFRRQGGHKGSMFSFIVRTA